MTSILKPRCPADLYMAEYRTELLVNAGQFLESAEEIINYHLIDQGSPFSERTIGGLLGALKIVGEALLNEGERSGEEVEAAKAEAGWEISKE